MPLSTFPLGVENVATVLPGTHVAGLFRNFFMQGALENLTEGFPDSVAEEIASSFSMKFSFFGIEVGADVMAIYVAGWLVVCAIVGLAIGTRLLDVRGRRKKFKPTSDQQERK